MTLVYIHESMNPYAVLVLFIPNNDETWMMCVDRLAINNITLNINILYLGLMIY
jgi:hypothetical protein